MRSVKTTFSSGDISLEGEWLFPDGSGPFPAVVVSHPYPPGGGTMVNSVVTAVWEALALHSIAAFRYNFRGVGKSEGSFADGVGEVKDVMAAFETVLSSAEIDKNNVGLAGYSFGAMMSAPVAMRDDRVKALALISAPLSDEQWIKLDTYGNPYLAVIGENDDMVSPDNLLKRMADPPEMGTFRLLSGTDHFLAGYEKEVGTIVADFFVHSFF